MKIFQQFINLQYIFDSRPPYITSEFIIYLAIFIAVLLGSIILKIHFDKKSRVLAPYTFFSQGFFGYFISCAIIGFVLLFFRWQLVAYLSSRILLYINLLVIITTLVFFIKYLLIKLPSQIVEFNRQQNYQKYIPKPRK